MENEVDFLALSVTKRDDIEELIHQNTLYELLGLVIFFLNSVSVWSHSQTDE